MQLKSLGKRRLSLRQQEQRIAYWMLIPTFLIVIAIVIFPVLWNLRLSFQEVSLARLGEISLFDPDFTVKNFRKLFTDRDFLPDIRTSLIYTVGGASLSLLLGLLAALLVNTRFPGRGVVRGLFLFPFIAPVIAVTYTFRWLLEPLFGIVGYLGQASGILPRPIAFLAEEPYALITVIFFEGWRYFPFAFLFVLARLQAIPKGLYEAAEVDGATPFQRFFYVTLPQLRWVLATIFLLRFLWLFNKFDDVFLLTGGGAGTEVLPVKLYDFAFGEFDVGAGAAVSVFLFLLLAVLLIFYFKWVLRER
ncbi:MAG: carbohydrate ABC transporter permease [Candidatus Bipolaricaulia bacterium]